jgi:NitT/TauT family transport system permease protein
MARLSPAAPPATRAWPSTEVDAPRPVVVRRRRSIFDLGFVPALVAGLALLGLWVALTEFDVVAPYLLPKPADVAEAFRRSVASGRMWDYTRTTLTEALAGFALGVAVALPCGYLIARSPLFARAIQPFLAASQAVPAVALAPILVLWLGYGLKSVAVLCALIVFFPMVVNTVLGMRSLDPDILDAARLDGASRWPLLAHIEVPLALPSVLAGMRTALTLSITGAVVGEFVLGDRGLGGLILIARGNFDTPLVFATLLMLMLLASALYGVARLIERRLSYLEE